MTEDDLRAFFQHRQDAFDRRDVVTLCADYAPDIVVESLLFGRTVGRDANEKLFQRLFSAFPDFTLKGEELLVFGNRILQTVMASGTDTGGFHGLPPTGRPFHVLCLFVFTFRERLITHERRIFDSSGLLLQLAGQSDGSIDNAQLYRTTMERARLEHDLKIAADIQRALAPQQVYQGLGCEIAATSLPCRAIGGDFFDYFDLADAFGFLLGDVSGKGPPAALLAAQIQGILASQVGSGRAPSDVLSRVNEVLMRRPIDSRFATLFLGVLSIDGRLAYSNAGHNPPLLIGQGGFRRLEKGGSPVGLFRQAAFESEIVALEPGDLLVVYSDGLTEAVNGQGEEFGEERLLSSLISNRKFDSKTLLSLVLDQVKRFSVDTTQADDVTLLVLKYSGNVKETQ